TFNAALPLSSNVARRDLRSAFSGPVIRSSKGGRFLYVGGHIFTADDLCQGQAFAHCSTCGTNATLDLSRSPRALAASRSVASVTTRTGASSAPSRPPTMPNDDRPHHLGESSVSVQSCGSASPTRSF